MVQEEGLGDLPVMILSSRAEEAEHKDWQKAQDSLLQLSTDSKRKIVEDSGHYIHHDQPKIVLDSIMEIIEKVN
ncbi:alpha/beta fold hydrolase [Neobacillus niacini]|uniref:alpha/beta fold hydrolase n=1 Tax=Neobacillus niacini TaxID=86668 RepID=UPI0021CB5F8E|nr:alpha/beta hydrolase [Neobacillus niacini]MCM3767611.1 alpha/beta hydrolase [Neobacillus niacini]